jgi:DNA-binding response OmpR family regulator
LPSAGSSPDRSGGTFGSSARPPAEAASKSACKARVLVVEDDPHARRAIVRILRHSNFASLEARTVKEAIEQLAQKPHWVLLDLMLPDGNGSEVLGRIRSDGLGVKVCLTTGCAAAVIEPLRGQVEHVFTKPIDVERLMGVLNDDCSFAVT